MERRVAGGVAEQERSHGIGHVVTGFSSARGRMPGGIESTATSAELAKVRGMTHTKPASCAASAWRTLRPMSAETHLNAKAKPARRARPRGRAERFRWRGGSR
jgi:hypothetical protein